MTPSKPRDAQRAKVYAAEQAFRVMLDWPEPMLFFLGSTVPRPLERKFGNLEVTREYVAFVNKREGGHPDLTVRTRRGDHFAHYERHSKVIAVPVPDGNARFKAVPESLLLHEITHHLMPDRIPYGPHGPRFAARYTELVGTYLGDGARWMLTTLMYEHNVKFTSPH